ncbi:hypothetical protein L3V65_11285 [Heyndrickxia coagulans]|uniref:hypothetical protein n=1 Tax=Heyndrickxia TaxID=2837504 RepID=UPI00105DC9D6|nr:hypothetical protein [Heyndrickxia coagulans]QWU06116.1 hypothetical protein KNH48_11260 [Heyndrickxia coagulans]UJZ86855.1 hypothetical protein L3V65_11285 [Heyndrickxia coagulans]
MPKFYIPLAVGSQTIKDRGFIPLKKKDIGKKIMTNIKKKWRVLISMDKFAYYQYLNFLITVGFGLVLID